MTAAYVELHTLPVGGRFRFFADDLKCGGPCTLIEKSAGRATIRYDNAAPIARAFTARDRRGQLVERTIVEPATMEPCALGAQVVPL